MAKGIGKVFKAVGNAVKKIAKPALIAGAVIMTGGALLGAMPALGAAGAAAGGGSGILGALGLSGTGGLGSFMAGITGGGAAAGGAAAAGAAAAGGAAATAAAAPTLLGTIGSALGSRTGAALLTGAAAGWAQGAQLKEAEQQDIRAEERRRASYEGAGSALSWGGRGLDQSQQPEFADSTAQIDLVNDPSRATAQMQQQQAAAGAAPAMQPTRRTPRRPGLEAIVSSAQGKPSRAQYNPDTGRIEYT